MKGENNRYNTLDGFAGLKDEQLAIPEHDELVLYLLNEENVIKLIPEISGWLNSINEVILKGKDDALNKIKRIEGGNSWGGNDEDAIKRYKAIAETPPQKIKIRSEVAITKGENSDCIVGFWDIVVELYQRGYGFQFDGYAELFKGNIPEKLFIEVKPEIESFGETLRQMNMYKFYEETQANVYLFTPDLKFKKEFEDQEIQVIVPPEI